MAGRIAGQDRGSLQGGMDSQEGATGCQESHGLPGVFFGLSILG